MVGRFQRHVFDAEGKIVETSQARFFPERMKQIFALETRGRCSTLGCDAPFHWLHADHIKPHSKHGESSHDNGEMRCGPDNMWKGDSDQAA